MNTENIQNSSITLGSSVSIWFFETTFISPLSHLPLSQNIEREVDSQKWKNYSKSVSHQSIKHAEPLENVGDMGGLQYDIKQIFEQNPYEK